jgi:predicted RNA binding protein YcfA (HicA-like mRNA interferase family)
MPRGFYNWSFKDVKDFLKDRGFVLNHVTGSHNFFIGKVEEMDRQVCVPFHTSKSLDPKVLKGIISQSGIDKKEWINKR